jgi:multiple sugar transport system permease protein/raffinose/stachyose/melibiose transport system permease protein
VNAVATTTARAATRRGRRTPWGPIVLFMAPASLLYLGFTAYPFLLTFYNSLHVLRMDLGLRADYVGFQHYVELLTEDTTFRLAVEHSVEWAVASFFLEVPIAFTLALILASKVRGTRFFRTAWFTPVLITAPVVAIVWLWIFNFDWGVINVLLRMSGLGFLATAWLGNMSTALPALIFVTTWMFVGFDMVILLAALHAVPQEYVEAARIDGATYLQIVRHIWIPLMRQTLVNLLILCVIGKLKQFALVYVMTRGGPLWATETVATYVIKRAFEWKTLDLGYPSAIAVLWFLVILGATLALGRLLHQREALEY